jgi:hypothetical protein
MNNMIIRKILMIRNNWLIKDNMRIKIIDNNKEIINRYRYQIHK